MRDSHFECARSPQQQKPGMPWALRTASSASSSTAMIRAAMIDLACFTRASPGAYTECSHVRSTCDTIGQVHRTRGGGGRNAHRNERWPGSLRLDQRGADFRLCLFRRPNVVALTILGVRLLSSGCSCLPLEVDPSSFCDPSIDEKESDRHRIWHIDRWTRFSCAEVWLQSNIWRPSDHPTPSPTE